MTELGTRLKEAREQKDLSLDDLQQITKIQKRYLVGIEEGNYSVMPGKFYVRAFIKQYAEAVGLNPEELFEEFKSEIPGTYNDDIPEQISRVQSRKQISSTSSKVIDKVPIIILALFLLGGAMTIYWFVSKKDVAEEPETKLESQETEYDESKDPPPVQDEQKEKPNEEEQVAGETDNAPAEEEEPVEETPAQELVEIEKETSTATYELKNTDSFKVKLTANAGGKAWVAVRNRQGEKFVWKNIADGQIEEVDLSNQSEVIFNIGKSSDLAIEINGEPFQYPFNTGEVVQQIFTIKYTPGTEE
ncbi:helix-turn-helix domain-containing protein [Bacillus timonensis]|uniref:Helix-turn-helix domain-containing protein n=1 Tax=Bacillus timonensis TaxID=1033734 RepID=A0A4S3PIB1_9BACI|nr:RodZ domain-containing protein [Bacillus timonensis]THE09091.1 helix-turn-helix domain-containing protein [Bacillus timonensis]